MPADNGKQTQPTEDFVGPYELNDFYLYYLIKHGFAPSKVFYIARHAFAKKYEDKVIYKWLRSFVRRFFTQQFKRSCQPDGVKTGALSLSPRADWKMPSDASYDLWMADLDELQKKYNLE